MRYRLGKPPTMTEDEQRRENQKRLAPEDFQSLLGLIAIWGLILLAAVKKSLS